MSSDDQFIEVALNVETVGELSTRTAYISGRPAVMVSACVSCGCVVALAGIVDHYPDRCAGADLDRYDAALQQARKEARIISGELDDEDVL